MFFSCITMQCAFEYFYSKRTLEINFLIIFYSLKNVVTQKVNHERSDRLVH